MSRPTGRGSSEFSGTSFSTRSGVKKARWPARADGDFVPETEYWQGEERFITILTVRLELAKLPSTQA